jgi:hypothetical protein
MRDFRTFVAGISGHWIHLRQELDGWSVELWGQYPFSCKLPDLTEQVAKDAASTLAKEHLLRHGLMAGGGSELTWRLAVRYTAA